MRANVRWTIINNLTDSLPDGLAVGAALGGHPHRLPRPAKTGKGREGGGRALTTGYRTGSRGSERAKDAGGGGKVASHSRLW